MSENNDEVALLVAQSGPLNGQRWALFGSSSLDGITCVIL